ncbi:MAG: prepilin-type N-terminal cleavage/methylation domain-containing protein [Elusimicrobiaceae bacterium]|nr:prepilin-type N-terminal cleavage/methylation domain-containing protein [Elusimicrobiaceae bacterium]
MKNKKKAFTLTEMLVVVIIIGVLAAVVLPKFNKIIETRKTTEAEEMMSAIRTEQERRCTLGKHYTMNPNALSDIMPNTTSKNYDYEFGTNGMLATSKGHYTYDLKMPSYADGRFCCDGNANGNQCSNLNKDYPTCTELQSRADFKRDAACTAEPYNPSDPPEPPTPPDPPDPPNPPDPIECQGEPQMQTQTCKPTGYNVVCGMKTRTQVCDTSTGQWTYEGVSWGTCQPVNCPRPCEGREPSPAEQNCTFADVGIARPGVGMQMCGKKREQYECNSRTGQWVILGWDTSACVHFPSRSQESKPCSELNASCTDGTARRTIINTCGADDTVHASTGVWNTSECKRFVGLEWERIYDPGGGGGGSVVDCNNLPDPPEGACSTEGEQWSGFECPSGSNAVSVIMECRRQYTSCI